MASTPAYAYVAPTTSTREAMYLGSVTPRWDEAFYVRSMGALEHEADRAIAYIQNEGGDFRVTRTSLSLGRGQL